MRIDEILATGEPVFSFEFFPPKTEAGERETARGAPASCASTRAVVRVGDLRRRRVDAGPRRSRSSSGSGSEHGLEAMAHFTCVGATVPELHSTLEEMAGAQIENVLALRGDPPAGQEQWIRTEGGLEYSHESSWS